MAHDGNNEFREYSSFIRFFCSRMIQAVVQARMGKMQPHPCSPNPDHSDYFNLIIDEIGEIAAYLKSTLGRKNYPPTISILTLEFILYTADGDTLPLESWLVRLGNECQDWPSGQSWNTNMRTTFYHQLSTLLRTLIVASRFTPTYRHYVSNQGPETFVITYRVFEGEPDLSLLGDERKYRRLGHLSSPFGALFVDLYYRTKMEIQPQPFVDECVTVQNANDEQGKAVNVPQEGSEPIAISPISAEHINLFSTSPISQDLSFTTVSPKANLGRSVSFVDRMIDGNRPCSDNDKQIDNQKESLRAPNSFPQHSFNKGRMRNNSFPFASLLFDSHSSSGPSLPKVPEYNTEEATKSHFDEVSHQDIRRDSLPMDGIGEPSDSRMDQHQNSYAERVIFACGSVESRSEDLKLKEKSTGRKDEDDGEEEEQSSDDSYVKVIAFADGPSGEDLGTDLSEFVKEVKLAPEVLRSFSSEPVDVTKQLDDFRAKEVAFNKFVTDLHDRDEEEVHSKMDDGDYSNR